MYSTVKGILLILFLYVALVWVGSAYRKPEDFVGTALYYTLVGLAVLLALVLGSWLFGLWKSIRARKAAQPKPVRPAQTQPVGSEDEKALSTLLREAAARLSASERFAKKESDGILLFSGMPLYLVVGFESAGKTSIISGLEFEHLAGQARFEKTAPTPTAIANVWLAGDALILELGGRHFGGDSRSWEGLLRILAAKPRMPIWQKLWKGERPGFELRGIIHCFDLRFFISKPGPEQIERQSQLIQDRLREAVKIFGKVFPVYTLFTKADQIPYFRDFFGRFPAKDAGQVLGCTLSLANPAIDRDHGSFMGQETKRLSKAFQALYTSLTERRLSVLFHEPFFAKKSKIYEFPREFARLRENVVGFLAQAFRPNALEPTAVNRGFYFCGTREVEASPIASSTTSSTRGFENTQIPRPSMDATFVLRGDPGEALKRATADAELNLTRVRRGGLQTQWIFLRQLFDEVIRRDRSIEQLPTVRVRMAGKQRTVVLAGAIAASAVLTIFLTYSWYQNWDLISRARQASSQRISENNLQQGLPSLNDLKSMEQLRKSVEELSQYDRDGVPYTMRLGLYSGKVLTKPLRDTYFKRLRSLLLNTANEGFERVFQSLQQPVNLSDQSYQQISVPLKVAMMISSNSVSAAGCSLNTDQVTRELVRAMQWTGLDEGDPRMELVRSQLGFYASELKFDNPAVMPLVPGTRRALNYLSQFTGAEGAYKSVIDELGLERGEPALFAALVPDYGAVLNGPRLVSQVFTPASWSSLHARIESGKPISLSSCMFGTSPAGNKPVDTKLDEETKRLIGTKYEQQYVEAWRNYLAQFSVVSYANATDAGKKLSTFSGYKSPLLGLLKFVEINTSFAGAEAGGKSAGYLDKFGKWVSKTFDSNSKQTEGAGKKPDDDTSLLSNAFQPVYWVMPREVENWVNEKNKAYIDSVAALAAAMLKIGQTTGDPDPQSHLAAQQAYDHALDTVRQIATGFNPQASGGVDQIVVSLLEAPIREVIRKHLINININPGTISKQKANGKLQDICATLRPVMNKYPFAASSSTDISLQELTNVFGPQGAVWNTQAADFAKFTVRDKTAWKQNPDFQELKASPELLEFLNKAQQITDAFFSDGSAMPKFVYTLRPPPEAIPNQTIRLNIDGKQRDFSQSLQLQQRFSWPAPTSGDQVATGQSVVPGSTLQFSTHDGPFAVFRMFGDAEPRTLGQKIIEWKRVRGQTGGAGPFEPSVKLEFVEFPGNIDIFNSQFFSGISCPRNAVQ